jgi:Domain of unknown function (DUF5667)
VPSAFCNTGHSHHCAKKLIRQVSMKIDHRINKIIENYLPAISSGQESIDSILEKYPQYTGDLRPRLEAAIWLVKARQDVEPRPGFIPSTRKYMEARFETLQPHGFWQRLFMRYSPQRWVFNLIAPIIVFLLLALVINSALLTAKLSIPGDPLYTTKLLTEDIQLALTFNQAHKTELYMQFSRDRTMEFVELVLEGNYERLPSAASRMETEIIASLRSLEDLTSYDPALEQPMIDDLRETLTNEIIMLNVLKGTSPPSALPGIELAIQDARSGLIALR